MGGINRQILHSSSEGNNKPYLTLRDYLDVELLQGMPFSFIRYPLSIIIRNIPSIASISIASILLQQGLDHLLYSTKSLAVASAATTTSWLQSEIETASTTTSLAETIFVWATTVGIAVLE